MESSEDIEFHIGNVKFELICDPLGDGACLFRCFSVFKTGEEGHWNSIKKEILNLADESYTYLYDIFRRNNETCEEYRIRLIEPHTYGDSLCIWCMAIKYNVNIFVCDYQARHGGCISTCNNDFFWLLYSPDLITHKNKQRLICTNGKRTILKGENYEQSIFLIRQHQSLSNGEHYQIIKPISDEIIVDADDVGFAKFW
jgi:hypothetical protein